jgi:hypothetical protein
VEPFSVRDDDRPIVRRERAAEFWLPALAVLLVIAAAAAYYFLQPRLAAFSFGEPEKSEAPLAAAAPAPAPTPPPEPAIRNPLDTTEQAAAPSLPTLENSDTMLRESVSGLIGRKAFAENVVPAQLVRRIVATVDNLPRPTAPRRMMPLEPVRGSFIASSASDATSGNDSAQIGAANFARYTPYVRVLESVDARALVKTYVRAYPLFQRAYEELGFPGKYFNDRLMEAIDDMLATPEIDGPLMVLRPKVLYEFADPDLETRSAGQKILLRMGKDNELRVKAKLIEVRRELIAARRKNPL